jgi:flagellin-specific chaperone FliS
MRNIASYQKNNNLANEVMSVDEQVSLIFKEILKNIKISNHFYEQQKYESSFISLEKSINLSVRLGEILNFDNENVSPNDINWKDYFQSLIFSISNHFRTRDEKLFQAMCSSLESMIDMWGNHKQK